MKKFLVTTANRETWPKNKEKIIFLGEWCRLHSTKTNWEKLNHEVINYHWDNRDKFENDYYYLIDFYEKLLKKLSIKMNSIHQVNHNLRHWRILLGPWLFLFIQSVFDKWEMIHLALKSGEKLTTNIIKESELKWTPYDQLDFENLVMDCEDWNGFIFGKIIELNHKKIEINRIYKKQSSRKIIIDRYNLKNSLFIFFQNLANFFSSKKSYLIFNTHLKKIDEFNLSLKLFQLPELIIPNIKKFSPKINFRKWKFYIETDSDYERFITEILPNQIPSIYLEGYEYLDQKVKKLSWPKSPKSIFISNGFYTNDILKYYAGINYESSLIIGQHGGSYGISKLDFPEYHELSIADKYISWGWTNRSFKTKIYPLGQINNKYLKKSNTLRTKLLLTSTTMPRYSSYMRTMVISSQWLSYFNDQIDFIKNLDTCVSNKTTVRLNRADYKWDQIARWKEIFPNLNYDIGFSDIQKLYQETKIHIATYNATSYLETFSLGIPTVIFWDTSFWENKDSVKFIFSELKRVKVFHDSPESAARHINQIWNNVENWWESHEVKEAIEKFNLSVNKKNKNIVTDIYKILK